MIHAVLPCAGDDEWCVVSLRSDADRRAAAELTGSGPAELPDALAQWTSARTRPRPPRRFAVVRVAAGPMNRAGDLLADPQLRARATLAEMAHPLLEHPLPTEAGPAPYRHIPPAPQRPHRCPARTPGRSAGRSWRWTTPTSRI